MFQGSGSESQKTDKGVQGETFTSKRTLSLNTVTRNMPTGLSSGQ